MAEAVCKDLIKKRNLDIEARSAGIMAPVGCPMSENAARALERAGITGFTHEAEELTPEAVDWADEKPSQGFARPFARRDCRL